MKRYAVIAILVGHTLSCVTPEESGAKSEPVAPTCKANSPQLAWDRSFASEVSRDERIKCLQVTFDLTHEDAQSWADAPVTWQQPPHAEAFCNWLAYMDQVTTAWQLSSWQPFATDPTSNLLRQHVTTLYNAEVATCSYFIDAALPCAAPIGGASPTLILRRSFCKALDTRETLQTRSRCLASVFQGLGDYSAKVILRKMDLKPLQAPYGTGSIARIEDFIRKARKVVRRYMKTGFSLDPKLAQALEQDQLFCPAFPTSTR